MELFLQGFTLMNIKRNLSQCILFYVHAKFIASKRNHLQHSHLSVHLSLSETKWTLTPNLVFALRLVVSTFILLNIQTYKRLAMMLPWPKLYVLLILSFIKLMKGKALRKHSLHEKTAASVPDIKSVKRLIHRFIRL